MTKVKGKSILIPRKYVEAVNNGVKWLDLTVGRKEWLKRMDMSSFDITDAGTCVVGNVFKDAFVVDKNAFDDEDTTGYERFESLLKAIGVPHEGTHLGFYAESDKGWQYLQDLWVAKITALKRAQARKRK